MDWGLYFATSPNHYLFVFTTSDWPKTTCRINVLLDLVVVVDWVQVVVSVRKLGRGIAIPSSLGVAHRHDMVP